MASSTSNTAATSTGPPRPTQNLTNTHSTSASVAISESTTSKKRRNHRGGKKKKAATAVFHKASNIPVGTVRRASIELDKLGQPGTVGPQVSRWMVLRSDFEKLNISQGSSSNAHPSRKSLGPERVYEQGKPVEPRSQFSIPSILCTKVYIRPHPPPSAAIEPCACIQRRKRGRGRRFYRPYTSAVFVEPRAK
ncbi:MAG: hypothetical protein Q9216_002095 [Gyalolechia sp. 2 TL-2023]